MQITELIQTYFHVNFGGKTVANWGFLEEFLGKALNIR